MADSGVQLHMGPDGATNKYALVEDVLIETIPAWPENQRTTGSQRRTDKINGSQQVIESLRNGMGYYKTVGQPPNDINEQGAHPSFSGAFDLEVETRWEGQITRNLKLNAGTVTNSSHDYRKIHIALDGKAIFLSRDEQQSVGVWNDSTNTVDQAKDLTGDAQYAWAQSTAFQHGGFTYIMSGAAESKAILKYNGSTYADLDPVGLGFDTISALSWKDVIYAAVWDSTNRLVKIYKSTDDGANFSALEGVQFTEDPQNRGPVADLVEYLDANGQATIYLSTDEILYIFDPVQEELLPVVKWQEKIKDYGSMARTPEPVTYDPEDGNGLRLYIPRDESLFEFHYSGGRVDVSPFIAGSVPAKYIGRSARISALRASKGWLFVALTNNTGATEDGWVFAYDGLGFHKITKIAGLTAATDGGISDIALVKHVSTGAYRLLILSVVSNTAVKISYIDDPLQNPLQNSNATYEDEGFVVLPYYDGGMSEIDTAVVEYGCTGLNLDTASNNDDKIKFQIDTNYSGSYETDSDRIITFYSNSSPVARQKLVSGNGLSARAWRLKITLYGGAAATDVALLYASVSYNKKSPGIHRYTAFIDLLLSVDMDRNKYSSPQDVWNAIHTADATIPLLDMRIIGSNIHSNSTRKVEIQEWPTFVDPSGQPRVSNPTMEGGNARIVFMEMFPE